MNNNLSKHHSRENFKSPITSQVLKWEFHVPSPWQVHNESCNKLRLKQFRLMHYHAISCTGNSPVSSVFLGDPTVQALPDSAQTCISIRLRWQSWVNKRTRSKLSCLGQSCHEAFESAMLNAKVPNSGVQADRWDATLDCEPPLHLKPKPPVVSGARHCVVPG